VVENLRFAIGILMMSVIYFLGNISTSGLDGHIAISGCLSSSKLLSLISPWSILSGFQAWFYVGAEGGALASPRFKS